MAMSLEQANYCDQLKTGNIEVALLRCDVISGRGETSELNDQQRYNVFYRAVSEDKNMDNIIDEYAFNAAKVVNTKLLEMMGYE